MQILPQQPGYSSIVFRSHHQTLMSRSLSGRVDLRRVGGHYWSCELHYRQLLPDEFDGIYAFLLRHKGAYEPFQVLLPARHSATHHGPIQVHGDGQSGDRLVTRGWPTNTQNIMPHNSPIVIDGALKFYRLVQTAHSDASGHARLHIEPELVEMPIDGQLLVIRDVPLTVIATDVIEYNLSAPYFYDVTVQCQEYF